MDTPRLIFCGVCGTVIEGITERGNRATLSGLPPLEVWFASLNGAGGQYAGLPVIDKRDVLTRDPGATLRSPILDVSMADNAKSPFGPADRRKALEMAPMLGGAFRTLAVLAAGGKASLDTVGRAPYLEWWRRAGARIGHIAPDGSHIVWDA